MHSTGRQQTLLLLAATLIFFVNLGGARLWDDDEPKNAQCAREMLQRGDWVVPTFNGGLRYDKPVLIYWLMIGAYQLFGDTEFAARFWSAVAAVGTTWATYHIGRILFKPRTGCWAGWIVASSLMLVIAGRAATPDSLMILCTTLAMLAFVRATWGTNTTLVGADGLGDFLPRSSLGMALVYACMALGVLAKGPVAVVLPMLVLVVYVAAVRHVLATSQSASSEHRMARWFSPIAWCVAAWKLRPLTASLVLAAVAMPWYVAVGLKTNGDWLTSFIGHHNVGRFLSPLEGHHGPFFYYLPAVFFGFFPWSVFLPQVVARVWRQTRQAADWAAYLFLGCWAGVWIGFFSLSGTKLPSYVTPAYPAIAVLTATWIDAWLREPEKVNRWLVRQSMASIIIVGVLLIALFPVLAHFVLPGEAVLGLVGLTLVLGGVPALRWAVNRPRRAAVALAATSLVFMVSLFGFAAVRASRHQNSAVLVDLLRGGNERLELSAFDFAVPSLVYYAHREVPQFTRSDDAIRHLRRSPKAVVITYTRGYEELKPRLPQDATIVARHRRFLRDSEVIVLGRPLSVARGSGTGVHRN